MKLIGWFPLVFVVDKIAPAVNARANPLFIRIKKDCQHFKAVLAQEVYEWGFMFRRSIPLMLAAAAAAIWLLPPELGMFFGPLLVVLGSAAPRLVPLLRREMELRGHMVEVIVAVDLYDANFVFKLHDEAAALTRYPEFKGWTLDQIKQAMLARQALCEDWVTANVD